MTMKVGDSKQAVILGLVALGAIAFLGKTISSSFGSKISNAPLVAKDLGTPGRSQPSAQPETSERADTTIQSVPNDIPDFGPAKSSIAPIRDAFSTTAASSPNQSRVPMSQETLTPTRPAPIKGSIEPAGFDEYSVPNSTAALPKQQPSKEGDHTVSRRNSSEQATTGGPLKTDTKAVTVRLSGVVDAGSPTAILQIGDETLNMQAGELLPNGFRVIQVLSDKVVLRKGSKSFSVRVGKEVEIK